ncbi:MAG: FoF1 ATP synthase subunit delta/epsilon [Planctomycetia bacterium]|jgi:F-type H+-transporting ATPase subunit epsilon
MAESTRSAGTLRCVIVTPEATVLDTPARFVTLPLFDGQRGIGRGHAPFIGRLGAGEVRITAESGAGDGRSTFVEGGFVEVGHDAVTVITQRAVPAEKLDAVAARADLARLAAAKPTGDEAIAARLAAQEAARAVVRTAGRSR